MTKRKRHSSDGIVMINVKVTEDFRERFRLVAEADHRTVSQEVRRLMELRIAESEREAEAA